MPLQIASSINISTWGVKEGGGGYQYLLDNIAPTTSRAAFSLRLLSSTYLGACIRVRRSTDNTEQDIGFNTYHALDTTALLSFCGVGSGFVTIVYDQSGNSRNRTQTIQNRQPRIVLNGVVETFKNKPAINFFQSTSCLQHDVSTILVPNTTNVSASFVYSNQQEGDSVLFWGGSAQYAYASSLGDNLSAYGQMSLGGNYIDNVLTTMSTRDEVYDAVYSPTNYISHQFYNLNIEATWQNRVNWGGYGLLGDGFIFLGYYTEEIYYNGDARSVFSEVYLNQKNYYRI
jgi:hypothetical protein